MKQVILVTGTPCVGKTTLAKQLADCLGALYVNLTDYAKQRGLIVCEDVQRNSAVVDEERMRLALTDTINQSLCSVVVDGHFAASVVSGGLSTCVFVLRRNPVELKEFMKKAGFLEDKMYENLSAEILDVCFVDALEEHGEKVCQLDVTGKSVEQTVREVLAVLCNDQVSSCGVVDWISFLEREGLTDHYLKG